LVRPGPSQAPFFHAGVAVAPLHSLTELVPAPRDIRVGLVHHMPAAAMRTPLATFPPYAVDLPRHNLKVVRIDAGSLATKVVRVESLRRPFATCDRVSPPMRKDTLAGYFRDRHAISVRRSRCAPQP